MSNLRRSFGAAISVLRMSVRYCRTLGWFAGLQAMLKIGIARLIGSEFVDFREPTTGRKIRLRAKSTDVTLFTQIFIQRDYDTEDIPQVRDLGLVEAACASRLTIIDCGANIGCSVLWFATKFPGAHIIAIEPQAENYELLLHNIRELPNVRAIRAAVWSTKTEVIISNPAAPSHSFKTVAFDAASVRDENIPESIPTITIDELIDRRAGGRCIVKIDIEGAESALFAENNDWLNAVDFLSIELHDYMFPWRGTSRNFFVAMSSRPRDYLWRGENLFCFKNPAIAY